ncbi:hypothetical protein FD24_GL001492 [Lactiplantibacillus pentosus DSM 20314]|uniref:Uncharacterized protein n=1 Tax=Lactiplantibacillus pentosus DSM 20314 TaxID=1423791 RepID=A0A837RES8_LACPE|nr:hypothetical protein FD24_GL001492 [Lactiplantibacillus pentosus DSM 20314]
MRHPCCVIPIEEVQNGIAFYRSTAARAILESIPSKLNMKIKKDDNKKSKRFSLPSILQTET